MKTGVRSKIEYLIKIAQTTSDEIFKEEVLREALALTELMDTSTELLRISPGVNEVCDAIMSALAESGGTARISEMDDMLQSTGISAWACKCAKRKLKESGKIKLRQKGMGGPWYMQLTEVIE